jgi:hypothetical protein
MAKTKKDDVDCPITSRAASVRQLHPAADKFKLERDYFRQIKDELAENPKYCDKFVAVLDNEVVGLSTERRELQIQMSKRFPHGGFYIGKVYPPPKD